MSAVASQPGLLDRLAKAQEISVTATPPPLAGPVLIGDVATPAGGQTLLGLLLKAGQDSDIE